MDKSPEAQRRREAVICDYIDGEPDWMLDVGVEDILERVGFTNRKRYAGHDFIFTRDGG